MSEQPPSAYHLAQVNVAVLRAPLDDPAMAEFTERLDPVNALADACPGFVWRLVGADADDATGLRPFGADLLVNLSVWEDLESLWDFTYRSGHLEPLRRRREWFPRMEEAHLALWWVPAGHIPDLDEAGERLEALRRDGPTPEAFTLRRHFPAPGAPAPPDAAAPA